MNFQNKQRAFRPTVCLSELSDSVEAPYECFILPGGTNLTFYNGNRTNIYYLVPLTIVR